MTITFFISLLTILAGISSLITESIKEFYKKIGSKYSANAVVLIVSLFVGVGGTTLTYIFLSIPFTLPNIICILLMPLAVWLGAMLGYDKVIQTAEQLKGLKK